MVRLGRKIATLGFYNMTIFYMLGGIPDTVLSHRLKLNMALDKYPVV